MWSIVLGMSIRLSERRENPIKRHHLSWVMRFISIDCRSDSMSIIEVRHLCCPRHYPSIHLVMVKCFLILHYIFWSLKNFDSLVRNRLECKSIYVLCLHMKHFKRIFLKTIRQHISSIHIGNRNHQIAVR